MNKEVIYTLKSLYRDDFRIQGYSFGSGEKSLCIVGATRGNEIQQQYMCSQIIRILSELEQEGRLIPGHEILVIPNVNNYSMNVNERFWPVDHTDINRMYPGYDQGETTQRIADGVFKKVKDYKYGIQLSSYYLKGEFMPHVRVTDSGFQDMAPAYDFGFEYVLERKPRPYDTTTLHYNWQIWGCSSYVLFTEETQKISRKAAEEGVNGILRFMQKKGFIDYTVQEGKKSLLIHSSDLFSVRSSMGGVYERISGEGDWVQEGEVMGYIIHPYEGTILETITAPMSGRVFFAHRAQLAMSQEVLFKILPLEAARKKED